MREYKHKRGCPLFTHPTQRGPGHPTDCRGPGLTPGTQTARLLTWLRQNPGSSSLDVTLALRIVNVTGRVSDLRASGYVVDCWTDKDRVARYTVRERARVTTGEPMGLGL